MGVGLGAAPVTVNHVAANDTYDGLKIPMEPLVALAGIVNCRRVSLNTVIGTLRAFPTHARFEPVKPRPRTVTTVPTGPEAGEKLMMVCCE